MSLLLRIKIQNRQDEKDRYGHDDRDAARFETGDRRKYHYDGYGKEGAAAATHCRIDSRRRSILRSLTLGRAEHLHFLYGFAIQLRSLPGPTSDDGCGRLKVHFPFAFSPISTGLRMASERHG